MKRTTKKGLQKATAILLSAIIVLSAFAVMPADLFKASAANSVSFDDRLELDFNNNWKFNLGDESGAYTKAYDDSTWETVELSHDFSISQDFFASGVEAESGNLPGGTGWYRKTFVMSSDTRDKAVILNFDGSYKDTYVYVNGELIGENHYGYNSFSFDISEYLTCNGETANIIAVKVENQLPSSRWYSGSGIYRDVTMTIADPVHVDLYGTYVTTPNLESSNGTDGTVNAVVSVTNAFSGTKDNITVSAQILDATGAAVGTVASSDAFSINGNETKEVTLIPVLSNPNLWNSWDLGSPYLYTLRTTISENGTVIDTYDTEFGFRWFNWDLDGGFSLNGTNVKLEGVCMHHDQGVLGSAQVYDAIYRQVAILKDMGCNAIRTSHGTPSDVFMDVCNELGMLVMDEFFDGWDMAKNSNSNDFSVYFDQIIDTDTNKLLGAEADQMWYEFVLTQSVKRDRNDPAVVIWDVGNEISEGAGEGDFGTIAANMRDMLDTLDPTRPICQGNNQRNVTSGWPYNVEKYMTVVGGNYAPSTWAGMYSQIAAIADAKTGDSADTGNPFVMTETTSALATRGEYIDENLTANSGANSNHQYSAYDTKCVNWGTTAAGTWYTTITNDWFSGAFVWTGFDYIGEPTDFNNTTTTYGSGYPNTSFFGIIDTAGFAKDTYYLYRSMWNEHSTTLHIVPGTWDSSALTLSNGYADVAVYSNAAKVSLLVNGNEVAYATATTHTTTAGHKYQTWTETVTNSSYATTTEFYTGTGKDLYPQFQVKQSDSDTISVKAYDASGNEITDTVGTKSVSAVEATKIVASTWEGTKAYTADGDSYVYIEYTAVDANGNVDTTYNGAIDITLNGNEATIVGVDNGNPVDTVRFQQNSVFTGENTVQVQMFNGKALVALRTNEEAGNAVEVTTTADDGISVDGVTFTTAAETGDELVDEFEEVIPQPENLVYEPTLYDEYEILYNEITAGGTATASNEYVEYTAGNVNANLTVEEMTSTDNNSFSDGWYIITGVADYMSYSEGAMTHTTSGSGFHTDGTTTGTVPEATTDSWYFERQSDGTFYIYYEDSTGTKQYLNLSSSNATASTTPQALEVVVSSSGVTIGNGSGSYLNYSGGESDVAGVWTAATSLTLYKVSGQVSSVDCPVENGTYVIYNDDTRYSNASGILSGIIDSIGIPIVQVTPSDSIITTESANAYTFTLVDGTTDKYYIKNSSGQYLSIGSSGGSIAFSDTATSVTVTARDDGSVFIYNADSSQFLDHYYSDSQNHYNTWSSTTSATDVNRIFMLYRNESGGAEIPAGKEDLYNALYSGIQIAPGVYSNATYKPFFEALQAGYETFKDDSATADEIAERTEAILLARDALALEYKYMPTTLWKYGYNPDATGEDRYIDGGNLFNTQTYESMKAIITADDDLMSQIKTAVGYDTATWASDTEKETALDTAVEKYAQIYSLSFTGAPIAGEASVTDFAKTRWNVWCKSNTQAAGETSEEGASVQGLFSALRADGQPADHAEYASLPYGNPIDNANRTNFNTADGLSVSLTINGSATDVTLPALNGISVHINDMFKKEAVSANDTADGYSKYYWDLQFPLLATTNEHGINTYEYKSSSSEYVFQAEFNDADHTATAQLTPVDEWSINRDSKGAGTGFFPFNYQKGTTTYTGENAIYHYAFNFDMEFYIPMSGTYADGEDVVFEFSGDDDVLVYIDDVLVLDNGGLHGARKAAINFTEATVSYQYAMDVDSDDENVVESTTENDVIYSYGQTADDGLNGDELAALEKLNEVRTDGDYHTFSFYFVERGSTDSNCEITFNLQQSSEHVLLYDQTAVVDYGLPVADFDILADNFISEDGKNAGTKIDILGIVNGNTPVGDIVEFDDVSNLVDTFAASGDTLTVPNMKYGNCTITKGTATDGTQTAMVSYTPNTIRMTGADYFYTCSEVTDDPTYAEGTIYHQYEKISFIPATTIYFEDNFGTDISFIDGTAGDGSGLGVWETVGDASAFANATQAADFAEDDTANPYGFDPVYAGADTTKDYTQYSGFSAQKVTVSAANNTKNGGTNPTVEFTFTGTGFDVISMTDNTTGVFYMEIFDENGTRVGKRNVVDTYYGYSYGQLYADENGETTLTETDKLLYKSAENEAVTTVVTYYSTNDAGETVIVTEPSYLDVSGSGYTSTPTYYDADGNLTTTETENVAYAYAYAYGWVVGGDSEGLYQIPVIKKTGLDYGTYRVVLTPMYTKMFDNTGAGQFDLYVDAIRIYDPAGKDDGVDSTILPEYKYDNESYANYLELKDMLIGADSLSEDSATQGIVFIDGIAALDNDLEKLKLAGPNNELYLAKGQAVAFEIWASAVPDEVQIGMKSAQGVPTFTVTYEENSANQEIKTATEMNYIINGLLPVDGKLTWSEVVVDGVTYYRTNTVVIQNTSVDDSILAITSLKWTFTGVGQYGHYEANVSETASVMSFMSSESTVSDAYTMMAANSTTDDDVTDDDAGAEIIPGDNEDTNDTNDEYQEELTWIQKIIKAITNFFKKIFGLA